MEVLPAGHQIGTYRIVRVAGRGAVGIVYEAEHTFTGKRVAIKTLNRTFAREPEFRARFDREAEGAASVDHPNITAVFDAGEQDGLPYLVMTYVDGPDLERILEQTDGPLDPNLAVWVCARVAEALDAAAAQGLAHRDVKPANVLLEAFDPRDAATVRPQVYLTDFGLTKHNAAATVTRTGQFVGTLLYMAPEQIEGHAVAASDQYSLACLLWECLGGTPPFLPTGGSNLSLLTSHLSEPVPSLSERTGGRFSPRLDRVFERSMAKRAGDRYPSCTAFMDAVAEVLGMPASTATSTSGTAPTSSGDRPGGSGWGSGGWPTASDGARATTAPDAAPTDRPVTQQPGQATPTPTAPATPARAAAPTSPQGFTQGASSSRPPGLPAGLSPDAYRPEPTGSGAGRWFLIGVALLVAAVIVALVIVQTSG